MISDNINPLQVQRTAIYTLPKFLSQIEHITTVDTGGLQFVICCDRMKLYIFPLITGANKPLGNIHQSLPIPNIKSLRTIAKNYLMIETQNKYIGIFQIIKSTSKQSPTQKSVNSLQVNAVKVQFSEVLKWRIFSCYFIREVMENLFEVQVFFTDLEFEIFQFTNKNKRGSMSFTISPNGKMQKCNKKQLYGSKCFFNIGRKLMYWLKNFSDKQFVLQEIINQQPLGTNKLLAEPFGYFGIQRAEEYKYIYANLVVRDCINPTKRYPLKLQKQSFLNELKSQVSQLSPTKRKNTNQQNPFNELVEQSSCIDNITQLLQAYKITTFTDLLMVENKSKKQVEIYQIKGDGSQLIGKQDSHILPVSETKDRKPISQNSQEQLLGLRKWEWYFGNSKKLIAIDKLGFQLKYIQDISLQTERQNTIQVEVVNLNQKTEESQQQSQKTEQKQDSTKVEDKPIQQPNDQVKEEEIVQKRKFSKDQLEKFCQEFKEEDANKYVSKQLIQKVDEVNNWTRTQTSAVQKYPQNGKNSNNKLKFSIESQNGNTQSQNKTVQKEQQGSPQPNNKQNEITQKVDQVKQQNPLSVSQQGSINVKEKPPMKIIQRNKISVAKAFQPGNQPKQNQKVKKQQAQKESVQIKQSNGTQKTQTEEEKKPQTATSATFAKYQVKQQASQPLNNDKQKKRFMKNFLSQEKKQQPIQQQPKQPETKNTEDQQKPPAQQKQEKVKFNVITRASLLKKKQVQASKPQSTQKQEKTEAVLISNKDKILIQQTQQAKDKQQPSENQQVKVQNQEKSQQNQLSPVQAQYIQNQIEPEPKTKYIASIDVAKASKKNLNECDFLSQDSVSDNENKTYQSQGKQQQNDKEDEQSIEQHIEGDQNDDNSIGQQPDLQHLIDDDIGSYKQKNEESIIKEQKLQQINPDQQIQKFCNTLLDEQTTPKYQKKESLSSVTKDKGQIPQQKIQIVTFPSNQTTLKSKLSESIDTKTQALNQQKRQDEDEMNKFNSLLFKTNIKRTNIFSSENSQHEEKKEQKGSSNDSKALKKNVSKSPETDKIKEQVKTVDQNQQKVVESPKHTPQQQPEKKKSKDWHGSSSQSHNDDQQSELKSAEQQTIQQNDKLTKQIEEKINIQAEKKDQDISKFAKEVDSAQQKVHQTKNQVQLQTTRTVQQPAVQVESAQNQQNKQFSKHLVIGNQEQAPSSQITPVSNPFIGAVKPLPNQTSIFPVNPPAHWLLNKHPVNTVQKKEAMSFTSFKKNSQENQPNILPTMFGLPPPTVIGGSNSNSFKKFLNERQNKNTVGKQEQIKEIQQKTESEIKKNEMLAIENKPSTVNLEVSSAKQSLHNQHKPIPQQKVIPTSALPQIQQLISQYEQSTIQLLEQQQKTIIKSLEQIPHTHNPYNKNNSLLLPEQIKEEIIKQSKNSVKKWLSTKMLDKIQVSFREIMQDHKSIYEEALKYYESEARRKITTMQLQYEQQSSILMDIENVSANMCAALQSSILQGEELHTYQLKQWKRQIQETQVSMIDPLANKVDDSKYYFSNRNKNLQNMTNELKEIKEILKEKLRKKKEIKELKEKKKQQKQEKLRQKIQEQANRQLKMKQQAKKLSKKRKNVDQNQGHVSFHSNPPQRQYEGQMYGRQPYQYY